MNEFIPCAGSIVLLFLILGFILLMRYLNYRETMQLAEKGLVKPIRSNDNGKSALISGIIITAIGLALIVGLLPVGALINTNAPFGFGPWMLLGLLPTFFGLALILIHVLTREEKEDKKVEQAQPDTSAKSE